MEKIQTVNGIDFNRELIFSSSEKSISGLIAKAEKGGRIRFTISDVPNRCS